MELSYQQSVCSLLFGFRLDTRYTDKYRWDVVRMDRELKIPFSETLNEIYLELPKFNLNFEECDTFYKKFLLHDEQHRHYGTVIQKKQYKTTNSCENSKALSNYNA